MIPVCLYRLRCAFDAARSERGAAMVEYAILVALIALVAVAAIKVLGASISTEYSDINSSIIENS